MYSVVSSLRWLFAPAVLSILPAIAVAQLGPSAAPMRLAATQCTHNGAPIPCNSGGPAGVSNSLSLTGDGTSTVVLSASNGASATCYQADSSASASGTVDIAVPAYTSGGVRQGTAQFNIRGYNQWALASAGSGNAAGWIEGAGWCNTGGGNKYCESVGSTPFTLGKRFLIRLSLDASGACQNPFRNAGAEQTSANVELNITDAEGAAVPIYYHDPLPGFVYGWGSNVSGELGDPSLPFHVGEPVLVKGLSNAVEVSAGGYNSAALLSDGTVWQWGAGGSSTPTQVALPSIAAIAKGYSHVLALTPGGQIWAWGANGYGQIGNGTTTDAPNPVRLSVFDSLGPVVAIGANERHSLAVTADGRLWAWGYWTVFHQVTTPEQVTGVPAVVAVSAGRTHSLALAADSTVWAWGFGTSGELGNGASASSYSPVQVSSLSGVVQISAGEMRSLALKNDRTAWAWGVGVGDGSSQSAVPKLVTGLEGLKQVSNYAAHSQVLRASGEVWGWGWDYYGQLADGLWNTTVDVPHRALNLNPASSVSAGFGHSLAIVPTQAYAVNVTVAPPGTGTVSGAGTYPAGTQIALFATPTQYYSFVSFSGDVSSAQNPLPLTVNASQNIVANFALSTFYTLAAAPSPAAGGTVAGGGNYAPGSTATVTATPAAGYQFAGFSGDLTGMSNPQTLVMNGPKVVSANFAAVVPNVLASVIGKNGGAATRIWKIQLANNGLAPASNAQITSLSFKQASGVSCSSPQVTPGNVVTTVAGNGSGGFGSYSGENILAVNAGVDADGGDVKVDSAGNIYVADYFANRVRKISAATGYIRTLAGTGAYPRNNVIGDGGPPENALLCSPMGLAFGPFGDLYIADFCNSKVRKINSAQTQISSLLSGANEPVGVTVDSSGTAYVFSGTMSAIRVLSICGTSPCWTTLIGSIRSFGGNLPFHLGFDRTGGLGFLQVPNLISRYPLPSGPINNVAIPGCSNCLSVPGLAFDNTNNLYVTAQPSSSSRGGQIWKRDSGGTVSVFAGSGNCSYDSNNRNPGTGDNGPARDADFCRPQALDFDGAGNLYVGESGRIRMLSPTRTLPATLGSLAAVAGGVPGTAFGLFTIDFGSCAANARFTVTVEFQANGGAYSSSTVLNNQFR